MLFALLVACTPEASKTTEPIRSDAPDVILIVLDTLRADALTAYGNPRPTSGPLSRLISRSTRFDEAYAPASWTVPSTATILTGLHPLHHGLRRPGDVMPEGQELLSERLRAAGWRTGAYSHNVNVSEKNGYNQGFDAFDTYAGRVFDYPHFGRMLPAVKALMQGAAPAFVYLQPMNCHGPYKVPKAERSTLLGREPSRRFDYYSGPMRAILRDRNLLARVQVNEGYLTSLNEQYSTAVRYSAGRVGALVDWLEAEGRFDGALIVLTADHGEELFDHGGFSHGYSLHREVLRVPLFVKLPGQKRASVVRDPVSLEDLVPTVMDALGQPVPTVDGVSLVPLLRGEEVAGRALLAEVDWKGRFVGRSLLESGWKLIQIDSNYEGLKDTLRLYDLAADPTEQADLSVAEGERAAGMLVRMSARVAGYRAATVDNVLEAMDHAQLEALGYLE